MVVSKNSRTFAPSNKNKQQFKTITTMTKEELAQKIAQGEYTDCKRDTKYSVSFKIGDLGVSAIKAGSNITAMTVLTTDIREEDYNKILKEALNNEMGELRRKADEIRREINDL